MMKVPRVLPFLPLLLLHLLLSLLSIVAVVDRDTQGGSAHERNCRRDHGAEL